MLKTQISKEELDRLGEDIRRHFDLAIVERGLEYQQKGLVYNTDVLPNRTILSKVQGTDVYDVKLDLDFFGLSECTCPYQGYCKHMAAVFFYVYAVYGRPDAFVKDWRQRLEEPRLPKPASKLHRMTALMGPSAQLPPDAPKPSAPAAEWIDFIGKRFESFASRNARYRHNPDEFYQMALQNAVQPTAWWPRATRGVFRVHAILFVLQRLEADFAAQAANPYYLAYSYQEAVDLLMEQLVEAVRAVDAQDARLKTPEQMEALAPLVSTALLEKPNLIIIDWVFVYRLIWSHLLNHEPWIERERQELARRLSDRHAAEGERKIWRLAAIHFDVMSGNDEQAWSACNELPDFEPDDVRSYLDDFHERRQWDRLLRWLLWLLPKRNRMAPDLFRKLCAFGNDAARQTGREEEWVRVLQTMLPASYYAYTDFLMKTGRLREWVEIHLAERLTPAELYPAELKYVESQDPSLLFPLYHQAIDRFIAQKSRTAYKEAVRLLKKLARLYKQAERTDRFEAYVGRLSRHYARLRAFQEELMKGKLIR